MRWSLITTLLEQEDDVVAARQRARAFAERLGFGAQDQVRIATAVSEIARNAYAYAGRGRVEYGLEGQGAVQALVIEVSDRGVGIADVPAILEGRHRSASGLGLGIAGARRLMDRFEIRSSVGQGTTVTLAKTLPASTEPLDRAKAVALAEAVARTSPDSPMNLLRAQQIELLESLASLADREEEARRLNRELGETNRGVVALYAELENRANQLQALSQGLENQVAARTAELATANEQLKAEAIERERVEQDLRQSQKMEAIGQLTGGIAHDFNNLLTGIIGSLDVMRTRLARGRLDGIDKYMNAATTSASRAAALTHRLLAFARRQPLDPKPTDANSLIGGMEDLLRRTISEAILLRVIRGDGLWPTLCDPHQLENAILNLAINARDAMPGGGTLTIETENSHSLGTSATPRVRQYVCIKVSDTGSGMTPDVIERAFDPFFTTKPLGQGTGLGLSMIYGFAQQSEGEANIESQAGRGTTVSLYLPRHRGPGPLHEDHDDAEMAASQPGSGERVLVVEDEAVVRDLIVEVLSEQGYRVLEAIDGPAGLRILQSPEPIDLVITDVGLPGLNGRQLADQARVTRPNLKVLFITGYAEGATISSGFLEPGMAILTKPFTPDVLMNKIRVILKD